MSDTPIPTSAILRAIAEGGYAPSEDTDGSTRKVLIDLAKHLEGDRAARLDTLHWAFRQ